MKEVIYRPAIWKDRTLYGLAQQATSVLEDVLETSAPEVEAEWDRGEGADGKVIAILRLSDFAGSATAIFEPPELESPAQLEARLRRLWRHLLQVRMHQILEGLLETGSEQGGR